jgi:signal transduction histidine kinase
MTNEGIGSRPVRTAPSGGPLRLSFPARLRSWLPPIDDRRFWVVQVLVVLVAVLHTWVEYQGSLDHSPVYLLPTTLFLIPVLYAAVTFGRQGAVLTAVWAAVLVLPNVFLLHDPAEGTGEVMQIAWITVVAVFVGGRVERERSARREAEFREQRQRDSEERYRAIVNNVGEPIVVLDAGHHVIEANDSATALFGRGDPSIRGGRLDGEAGVSIRALLDDADDEHPRSRIQLGQQQRWYEPVVFRGTDSQGTSMTQILLVDVTVSTEREQGLESITRRMIATREEEQRRISRELHDGPLQSLVGVWRDLDSLTSRTGDPLRADLLRARGATESVANELRRFSRDLRPSILDDLGIAAALRAEAERVGSKSRIGVRVESVGTPRRLGTDAEIALLRIAQEALRNVVSHAGASIVRVTLEFGAPDVRLRIEDDGAGLDPIPTPSELLRGDHLGMIGMQERARMIGGSVAFRQGALGGLEVVVEVRDAHIQPNDDPSPASGES